MDSKSDILILVVFCMIWGIAYDQNMTNSTLKIQCDQMMYSDNWTLGYLRNVSAYCSNGGPQ